MSSEWHTVYTDTEKKFLIVITKRNLKLNDTMSAEIIRHARESRKRSTLESGNELKFERTFPGDLNQAILSSFKPSNTP